MTSLPVFNNVVAIDADVVYIYSLILYKMLLEKDSTGETSCENEGKNSRFDFFIYISAWQLIGSDTLTIRRALADSMLNTVSVSQASSNGRHSGPFFFKPEKNLVVFFFRIKSPGTHRCHRS